MRRDIDKRTYDTLAGVFADAGAQLHLGAHEGSTYAYATDNGGHMYLCASDGAYWLENDEPEPEAEWPIDWEWADDGAIVVHA